MMIFNVIKTIINVLAYSALIIFIFAFIYVRNGGEIDLRWDPEDDDYDENEYDDRMEL